MKRLVFRKIDECVSVATFTVGAQEHKVTRQRAWYRNGGDQYTFHCSCGWAGQNEGMGGGSTNAKANDHRRLMEKAALIEEKRIRDSIAESERKAQTSRCSCGQIKDPLHDSCFDCGPPPPVSPEEDLAPWPFTAMRVGAQGFTASGEISRRAILGVPVLAFRDRDGQLNILQERMVTKHRHLRESKKYGNLRPISDWIPGSPMEKEEER